MVAMGEPPLGLFQGWLSRVSRKGYHRPRVGKFLTEVDPYKPPKKGCIYAS